MAGGATTDTFTVSNVSYSGTTLSMSIHNTTYGMKNPEFVLGSDSGNVTVTRSGYLNNPYTLLVDNINITPGNTYNLSINYMDNTDSGTAVTASGTYKFEESVVRKIVQLQDGAGHGIYPNVWIEGMSETGKVQLVDKEGALLYPVGVISGGTQLTDKNGNNIYVIGFSEPLGNIYSVSFDTNGGTPDSFTRIVRANETVPEPTNVTKEHYNLLGWEIVDE